MTKRDRERIRRHAAVVAVGGRRPIKSLAEIRAATQWVEMRRASQKFEWGAAIAARSTAAHAGAWPVNGAGHVGAI
jgi:hypothetical protein